MRNAVLSVAIIIFGCSLALGQATEQVLYSFGPPPDAQFPSESALVSDHAGNIYGVGTGGGNQGGGAVFELTSNGDGSWSEAVLYSFCYYYSNFYCPDGAGPVGLTIDGQGNLLGTTTLGGTPGGGTVFELSPPSIPGGAWTYSVIYNFCSLSNCSDGYHPDGPPALDKSGNLYGTTVEAGTGVGNVWELSPSPSGWNEAVIYDFCSLPNCADGENPETGVTIDRKGNLYGTTLYGGSKPTGGGTLYELSPTQGGWTERVLASFSRISLAKPTLGPATIDPTGNVYTTFTVPRYIDGAVVSAKYGRPMKVFQFDGSDGSTPLAGVIVDAKRRLLYGTVEEGGPNGCGGVFQINASGQESIVYNFCQFPTDAAVPGGALREDAIGNLYGATQYGGAYGYGAVFEITP